MSSTLYQFPNITSLRFILASLVMVGHVWEFSKNRGFPFFNSWPIFNKSTEAVYLFFSLSGFLIIKQLYTEKATTNNINLKKFYTKRALRIFPLYYFVLLFGFLYYHFILKYFGFEYHNNYDLATGLLLSLTFFSNIFSTYAPGGILEILWSIGIEEQFYLVIAPLLLVIPKNRILQFLCVFTMGYFLLFSLDFFHFLISYQMVFFYFSFAGFCALYLEKNYFQKSISLLRYPLYLIAFVYFTTNFFKNNLEPFYYQFFSFILFGLFIAVFVSKPLIFFQNKWMVYLGKISYGLYMYHAIVLQFVGLIYLKFLSEFSLKNTTDIVLINLLVFVITITVAHFSYKYFESYFIKLKSKV